MTQSPPPSRRTSRVCSRPLTVIGFAVALSGCAVVRDAHTPLFGRAPVSAEPCAVSVVRALDPAGLTLIGTRMVEGSVFLTPFDAERILRSEACAAKADVVLVTSESYGVPFVGSSAVGSLYRRN